MTFIAMHNIVLKMFCKIINAIMHNNMLLTIYKGAEEKRNVNCTTSSISYLIRMGNGAHPPSPINIFTEMEVA